MCAARVSGGTDRYELLSLLPLLPMAGQREAGNELISRMSQTTVLQDSVSIACLCPRHDLSVWGQTPHRWDLVLIITWSQWEAGGGGSRD